MDDLNGEETWRQEFHWFVMMALMARVGGEEGKDK